MELPLQYELKCGYKSLHLTFALSSVTLNVSKKVLISSAVADLLILTGDIGKFGGMR